jgi:hypothetical protein
VLRFSFAIQWESLPFDEWIFGVVAPNAEQVHGDTIIMLVLWKGIWSIDHCELEIVVVRVFGLD